MGGIDPDPVAGSGPQTHVGTGLGAVAVQHVRPQFADHALESGPHQKIARQDRKSTRLNSSHRTISYAVFCLKKKKKKKKKKKQKKKKKIKKKNKIKKTKKKRT